MTIPPRRRPRPGRAAAAGGARRQPVAPGRQRAARSGRPRRSRANSPADAADAPRRATTTRAPSIGPPLSSTTRPATGNPGRSASLPDIAALAGRQHELVAAQRLGPAVRHLDAVAARDQVVDGEPPVADRRPRRASCRARGPRPTAARPPRRPAAAARSGPSDPRWRSPGSARARRPPAPPRGSSDLPEHARAAHQLEHHLTAGSAPLPCRGRRWPAPAAARSPAATPTADSRRETPARAKLPARSDCHERGQRIVTGRAACRSRCGREPRPARRRRRRSPGRRWRGPATARAGRARRPGSRRPRSRARARTRRRR